MKREFIRGTDRSNWRSYIIVSKIGKDQYFQGTLELPFNKESEENSLEILKIISDALGV